MINELNGKLVELNSEISKLLYQVNTLKQNPEAQSEYATKTIELSVSSIEHKILSLDNFFKHMPDIQERFAYLRSFFIDTFLSDEKDEHVGDFDYDDLNELTKPKEENK